MGTIKNISENAVEIRGQRLAPGESASVRGKMPPSVRILVDLGALTISDVETTENEDAKFTIGKVKVETAPLELPPPPSTDETLIKIIRGLPPEAFMADGRPEVRAINEAKGDDLPNITAAERDRVWEAMGSKV